RMIMLGKRGSRDRVLRVDPLLDWRHADAPVGVQERFVLAGALLEIDVDDPLDGAGDVGAIDRRAGAIAERGVVLGAAAERDLVPLLALLADAQDADVADAVVAAAVHTARHLDLDLADFVL